MGYVPIRTRDRLIPVDLDELARQAGGIQTYVLLYEQLNAKAYSDHRENDFALLVDKIAGEKILTLYSRKRWNVLSWMVCPKEFSTYFADS